MFWTGKVIKWCRKFKNRGPPAVVLKTRGDQSLLPKLYYQRFPLSSIPRVQWWCVLISREIVDIYSRGKGN